MYAVILKNNIVSLVYETDTKANKKYSRIWKNLYNVFLLSSISHSSVRSRRPYLRYTKTHVTITTTNLSILQLVLRKKKKVSRAKPNRPIGIRYGCIFGIAAVAIRALNSLLYLHASDRIDLAGGDEVRRIFGR